MELFTYYLWLLLIEQVFFLFCMCEKILLATITSGKFARCKLSRTTKVLVDTLLNFYRKIIVVSCGGINKIKSINIVVVL
jgi:hypothetical protein